MFYESVRNLEKTVCELFAGVGGFRCGLNHILTPADYGKKEKWDTVWYNQWEPAEKTTQYAYNCYKYRFGSVVDTNGEDTSNVDIEQVNKSAIPDFNLLVGGFPCQDYSVASTLASSKGIEGKKGVLWWSIREVLEKKNPPFVLLENVDRLIKSPASQRGRDFGIILSCLNEQGYTVEWRVINAAEYGFQQRRRRIFIFAYKNDTKYAQKIAKILHHDDERGAATEVITQNGFFASSLPVTDVKVKDCKRAELPESIGEVSSDFVFMFENAGIMSEGIIYTVKTTPEFKGKQITLGDILEQGDVEESYFIKPERLAYKDINDTHSDELEGRLPREQRQTWQYLKGSKKFIRKASNGHEYVYSEGAIPMIDANDKPARTMLTSEGSFNRSTHIVKDKMTGKIRLLTAAETERIQGFPTDHTKYCYGADNKIIEMPLNKRRFMMGNALLVNLVAHLEKTLSKIFDNE